MTSSKRIFLSADAAICCAGKTWDGTLQQALCNPEYKTNFQPCNLGESTYPVAIIPDSYLSSSFQGNRIENIITQVLKQIKNSVAECIQKYGAKRVGICIGSCDNGSEDSLAAHKIYFETQAFPAGYSLHQQSPAQVAAFIKEYLGLEGPAISVATACASSTTAVIEAAQIIGANFCDAMVVVGVDIVSPTVFLGFNALEAVSPTGCNPFSKNRNGITLGEAVAAVILTKEKPETDEYVELLGFGESADANHMTAPLESGDGAVAAMEKALAMAAVDKSKISYINLHGTGTSLNDAMESKAVAKVFCEAATIGGSIKVSSTKAITGHTLGAAGCLELSICMRTCYDKQLKNLPIHRWDGERDEELPQLHFVQVGDTKSSSYCMTNSFAFGGCNTSLVIGRE